jgi:hypothetical protein
MAITWTTTNRTRHVATRTNFPRALMAKGTISVKWVSNHFMPSDVFTKNVGSKDLNNIHTHVWERALRFHSIKFVAKAISVLAGEGVGVGVRSPTENPRKRRYPGDGKRGLEIWDSPFSYYVIIEMMAYASRETTREWSKINQPGRDNQRVSDTDG